MTTLTEERRSKEAIGGKTNGAVREYRGPLGHYEKLLSNGVVGCAGIVHVLLQNGVLDGIGNMYPPTKEAVLALLKHHADGGSLVAIPIRKLALELGSKVYAVSQLLNQLTYEHKIRRFEGGAPGRLLTTEIIEAPTELDQTPLSVVESHLLGILKRQMDTQSWVQTDEQEIAAAMGVSHETAMATLFSLRRRGYINATIAEYGRPCIVKVLHEEPVAVEAVPGHNVVDSLMNGRAPVGDDSGKEDMLVRFLRWQKDQRALEQEQIGEMLSQLTGN